MLRVRISLRRGVLDITLCDNVCQKLTTGRCFSPGTPVSSTNKTDSHDITEILLEVALSTKKTQINWDFTVDICIFHYALLNETWLWTYTLSILHYQLRFDCGHIHYQLRLDWTYTLSTETWLWKYTLSTETWLWTYTLSTMHYQVRLDCEHIHFPLCTIKWDLTEHIHYQLRLDCGHIHFPLCTIKWDLTVDICIHLPLSSETWLWTYTLSTIHYQVRLDFGHISILLCTINWDLTVDKYTFHYTLLTKIH